MTIDMDINPLRSQFSQICKSPKLLNQMFEPNVYVGKPADLGQLVIAYAAVNMQSSWSSEAHLKDADQEPQ